MSSPEPLEAPGSSAASTTSPVPDAIAARPSPAPAKAARSRWDDNPITGWARAIALGIRDTAEDMLDEGRKGTHEAYEEGWRRYDTKTKKRRRP